MTNESDTYAQAEPGKAPGSTFERKEMSFKTLRKRIALVAVAALAVTGLSTVPANAANEASDAAVVDGLTFKVSGTVGSAHTQAVTFANTANGTGATASTVTFTVAVAVKPTGSTATATLTKPAADTTGYATTQTSATVVSIAVTDTNGDAAAKVGTLAFTPDVPGEYQLTITPAGAASTNTAGKVSIYAKGAGATIATSGIGASATTGAAGGQVQFNFMTSPTATAGVYTASETYTIVSSGVGSIQTITGTEVTIPTAVAGTARAAAACGGTLASVGNTCAVGPLNGSTGDYSSGAKFMTGAFTTPRFVTVTLTSAATGTQTVAINLIDSATGAPSAAATMTITWGAAPTLSVGTTTSILNAGTGTGAASDTTSNLVSKTAAGQQFNIVVTVRDQNAVALKGQTVSASIAGPGLIAVAAGNAGGTGTARAGSVTLDASSNVAAVGVNADGTSGTGTITILVGSTVVATETVLFYDDPAKVEAKQLLKVGSSAGGTLGLSSANPSGADVANTPAVIVTVTDKNGFRIPSLAKTTNVTLVSSNPLAFSTDFDWTQSDGTGLANTVTRTYNAAVKSVTSASGATSKLKFRVALTATTFVESNELTFAIGGGVNTVTLSLDKATYTLGAPAVATVTAKDSSGNAAFDADHANILAAALTSSLAVNKALFGTTVSTVGGVSTVEFNAPTVANSAWTVSGTTGTGPATDKSKAVTASASVTSAVDAQIASLIAAIAKLQKAINKIQKRLNR